MKRPKHWTSVVIDVGKSMGADGNERLSHVRDILGTVLTSKITKEDEAVGVVLVGSGSFNRRDYENIVEYGSLGDDRQPLSLTSPDANMLMLPWAQGNGVHGDLGQALCLAVESITSDPQYDSSTCTARVLVCTDCEGPTDESLLQAAVTDAKGAAIMIDLLLVDPKHSNAAAGAHMAGLHSSSSSSQGEEPDPTAASHAQGAHDEQHPGKKGKGGAGSLAAATDGADTAGSHTSRLPMTAQKVHSVAMLMSASVSTGGRQALVDEEGNADAAVYDIIAPPRAPSGKKPFAPLTLAGKPIAYVTVYGLVMEAKAATAVSVSAEAAVKQEGERQQQVAPGEAAEPAPHAEAVSSGTGAGGGGSGGGGQTGGGGDVLTAAGITKDRIVVRDLTRAEREELEQAGQDGGQDAAGSVGMSAADLAARQVPEEHLERVYTYGSSQLAISTTLETMMKLPRGEAELEILSFVPLSRFPRYMYKGTPYILAPQQPAGKVNEGMRVQGQLQLEALAKAMAAQGKGCLIRHRHNASTDPSLYLGIPCQPHSGQSTAPGTQAGSGSLGENPVSLQTEHAPVSSSAASSAPWHSGTAAGGAGGGGGGGVDPATPMRPEDIAGPAYEHPLPHSPLRDGLPAIIMVQIPWNEDIRSEYIFQQPFTRAPLGVGAAGVPDLRARTAPTSAAQQEAANQALPASAQLQLQAMDSLIDALDLTAVRSYAGQGVQPERSLNPGLLAKARTFAARAVDPQAPLQGPSDTVLRYTDPRIVWRDAGPPFPRALDAITSRFGLEAKASSKLVAARQDSALQDRSKALTLAVQAVSSHKRRRVDEGKGGGKGDEEGEGSDHEDPRQPSAAPQNEGAAGGGSASGSGTGGLLAGFLGRLRPAQGSEGPKKIVIGTGTPVLDFQRALQQHQQAISGSSSSAAVTQMDAVVEGYLNDLAKVALRLARDPQELDMDKVLACLRELRAACLQRAEHGTAVGLYNSTLRAFKTEQGPSGPGNAGRRVWRRFCSAHSSGPALGLITVLEAPQVASASAAAAVTQAEEFLAAAPAPVTAAAPKPAPAPAAADDDDVDFD